MVTVLLALVAGLALLAVVFIVGMRTRSLVVLRPLFWISKRFMNPVQMRTAGTPGAYASIIRAPGRRTGQIRATPVGAIATDDGFLIALPYSSKAQWLQNVLAAGGAELVTEGVTYRVDRPEIIATRDVVDRFSATDQRLFRLLATNECLRLRRAAVVERSAAEPLAA